MKKPIIWFSIIGAIAYYLQFVGISLITGRVDIDAFGTDMNRYMNVPPFSYIVLIFLFYSGENIPQRYLLFIMFVPMIFLPLSRGFILAFIAANAIYLIVIKKDWDTIGKFILPTFIIVLLFLPLLVDRFSGSHASMGFVSEIQMIHNLSSSEQYNMGDGDTFLFRYALFMERLEYLIDNPKVLFLGIGSIYESENLTSVFNFRIGSAAVNYGEFAYSRQIETTDLSFISHWIRYGIMYMVFVISFIFLSIKRYLNHSNSIYGVLGLVIIVSDVLQCFVSAPFIDLRINRMFPLLLFAAVLNIPKSTEKQL